MEKEQLFKVLDALEASVEQLQEYIAKVTDATLVEVIYELPNGQLEITKNIIENAIIIGYVLDDIVLFYRTFDQYEKCNVLTIGDIRRAGAKIHPKARPISKTELRIMCLHAYNLNVSMEHLAMRGYDSFNDLPKWFIPIDKSLSDDKTIAKTCDITGFFDGQSNLRHFAEYTGNFYYFCKRDEL